MRFLAAFSRSLLYGLLAFGFVAVGVVRSANDPPTPAKKKDEDAALKAAAAFYDGIRTETLPNGLRVYLKPVPGQETVTTMVAYKVGSADEDLTSTGLSHYLEHLMFKGTDKIAPGDIDRLTLRNGGANNAYTSEDYTIYHFDFAADRWEAALEIEADRMQHLRIDTKHEFEQEKGAVISELKRNEDEPWDLEQKAILPLLFGDNTPYGHPVIGKTEHVRGATAEIIKSHYDKWYHPNNAALIICGGFDPDKTMAKVRELFGPIPAAKLPERKPVPKGEKRDQPVRLEMDSKFESPRMLMGFNTVPSSHPDFAALEVLSSLLTGGKTGRLYKKLVEGDEIASAVGSGSYVGRYPGWFGLQIELLPGKERAKAEKLVVEEVARLRKEPVATQELRRVQETLLTNGVFGRESVHNLADSIAQGVTTNNLEYLKNSLPSLLKVTPADVVRVAQKYLDPEQRVVVWSFPKRPAGAPGLVGLQPQRNRSSADKDVAGGGFSLKKARREVLPNGLVLLLYEDHRLPIVAVEAAIRHVALLEPANKAGVATLMGYLLDEGTTKHTGEQIAELAENAGATLSLTSAGGGVHMLSTHKQLGLSILLECLSQPNFPKDEFARQKGRLLSQIEDTDRRPDAKAQKIFRQLVYGKHPFGRPALGTRETVEPLNRIDCAAFHRRVFVPNNTTLAVIGDFDSEQMIDEIKRLTADWKKGEALKLDLPEVQKPQQFTEKIVTMPEAAQLHFFMGHHGIRRNNPDYYKLLVMDYVLGTGPGFTDRLSSRLRDREGLAYTVQANISSTAGEEPGIFSCYIGTDPENFERVKKEFLEELNLIRDQLPSDKEVEDARQYLLGSLPFQFTTIDLIGAQLLYVERNHLGFNYLDDYRKAVAAVTPQDVQAMAQKYLDPKRMVLVATGAIDEKGKPIQRVKPPRP